MTEKNPTQPSLLSMGGSLMRILITGPNGQIGSELVRALAAIGDVVAVDRAAMDLSDPASIRQTVRAIHPDLVVNAAGYTNVDRAQHEPELAQAVNGEAPGILAGEAAALGAAIVHYSTDYVFDGETTTPYTPNDEPNPINVYGTTKLAGEKAIMACECASLILRTSWVYSKGGSNFLSSILTQTTSTNELRVVDDQFGCPTSSRTVADATMQIITAALRRDGPGWSFSGLDGIYHVACQGVTSRYEFARRVFGLAGPSSQPTLIPVAANESPSEALRPQYSALCCDQTTETFGIELPHWETALKAALQSDQRSSPRIDCANHGERS